ncbi:hypothetical protein B0O80DRAFT_464693 [Mortierella sp. GBAus27b]|nr:hypothetical protein B0O80DRAFT_464693 [Mortierella sp. GBAus27b]
MRVLSSGERMSIVATGRLGSSTMDINIALRYPECFLIVAKSKRAEANTSSPTT